MPDIPEFRTCTKCGLVKRLEEFSRHKNGKYGRKPGCKACDAARHAAQFVPKPVDEEAKRIRYTKHWDDPKLCRKCGARKDRSEFHKLRDGKYGPVLQNRCKPCQRTETRRYAIVRAYGITVEEYDAMLAAQGGVCAVCKRPERAVRGGKPLLMPVDHDHRTGRARGIPCHACNRAIGLLGDDPDRIRALIRHLQGLPPRTAPDTR